MAAICVRNQLQVHNLLLQAVEESGLTQKELAKRTGLDEATLSRTLAHPKNLEINTISKIVYAACGAALGLSFSYPQSPRSTAPTVVLSMGQHQHSTSTQRHIFARGNKPIATALSVWTTTDMNEIVVRMPSPRVPNPALIKDAYDRA